MIVRDITKSDCLELSKLRLKEENIGFLQRLGYRFYSEILKGTCYSNWGFGKVCVDNDNNVGFIIATTHLKKYYADILLKRGFHLLLYTCLQIMRNSDLLKGVIEYILYPKTFKNDLINAEWLTMVVADDYRSRGMGKLLTSALIDEYRKRNIYIFKSTVMKDNLISCKLHKKFGFHLLYEINFNNKIMNVYKYEI